MRWEVSGGGSGFTGTRRVGPAIAILDINGLVYSLSFTTTVEQLITSRILSSLYFIHEKQSLQLSYTAIDYKVSQRHIFKIVLNNYK